MNALKLIFFIHFQVFTEYLEHPEYPPLVHLLNVVVCKYASCL